MPRFYIREGFKVLGTAEYDIEAASEEEALELYKHAPRNKSGFLDEHEPSIDIHEVEPSAFVDHEFLTIERDPFWDEEDDE